MSQRILQTAWEQGINHIETAQAYGDSEVMVGRLLQEMDPGTRQQLTVTTKLAASTDPEEWQSSFERSRQRLQMDTIDCLAFHGINRPDHLQNVLNYGLPTLQRLQQKGRIRHLGFSTHGSLDLILETIATGQFDFIFLHYYFFNQRNAPAIAAAIEEDMGIFIISPADKGGMLYRPSHKLQELCQPLSPLTFGYQFLFQDPRIHTLSVGPETPTELQEALAALTAFEEWETLGSRLPTRLDQAARQSLGSSRCAQCFDCLPCPESIPIPDILRLRNLAIAYDMTEYGQYRYNMLGQAGHWFPGVKGNACTECGDCLPRCPESLAIPALLDETHKLLNQNPIRRLWE